MQFRIQILACILFETSGEVELQTSSSTDGFVAVCDEEPLVDFDLVWSFTHLGDGGLGLAADNGGNDASLWMRKKKLEPVKKEWFIILG